MANHLQEIKKSVSFIFVPEGADKLKPNGTGFFVGVKNEDNENIFNVYFVTAKHVLKDKDGNYLAEIVLLATQRLAPVCKAKLDQLKTKLQAEAQTK